MRWVAKADIRPHCCFMFPHLGSSHPKGYLDTGNDIVAIDPHGYLCVEAVEQSAQFIGYPSREEHAAAVERVAQLEQELEQTKVALAEADRLVEAIDVLESRDFRARKKPGRPRKNDEMAGAA